MRGSVVSKLQAVAALVVLAVAAGCAHPIAPVPFDPSSPYASVPIDNFAEVAPGIYRGAQPDEAGFRSLKEVGFKTVVDLCQGGGDPAARQVGLDVVHMPMSSFPSISAPSDEQMREFLGVVTDAARQPVFIHCAHGCDRTGLLCALYRMEVGGWSADKALAEMRDFGWHEWFYGGLGTYVSRYKPHCAATTPTE